MTEILIAIIVVCAIVGVGAIILDKTRKAMAINIRDAKDQERWREARYQNIMNKYEKLIE